MKPGFTKETYVAVHCTSCTVPFGEDNEGVPLLFETEDAAAEALRAEEWWLLESGPVCLDCANQQACHELGHAWEPWRLCRCDGRISSHATQMQVRHCVSCAGAHEERPATAEGGGFGTDQT